MKTSVTVTNKIPTFWRWFWQGYGARPGYRRVLNSWLFLHVIVGILCATQINVSLAEVAVKALLPLMAIFVGLTFSWAGNAHALLQSEEIVAISRNRAGGISEYIFTFQLCILIILISVGFWVLPSLNLSYHFVDSSYITFNMLSSVFLYALLSLAFRTSWQAVLGANMLLLMRVIKKREAEEIEE